MAGHESGTNFVCLRDMDLRLQMLLLLWRRRLLLLLLLWRLHRWRLIEFKVGSTLCCVLMVLSKTCPRVAAQSHKHARSTTCVRVWGREGAVEGCDSQFVLGCLTALK